MHTRGPSMLQCTVPFFKISCNVLGTPGACVGTSEAFLTPISFNLACPYSQCHGSVHLIFKRDACTVWLSIAGIENNIEQVLLLKKEMHAAVMLKMSIQGLLYHGSY